MRSTRESAPRTARARLAALLCLSLSGLIVLLLAAPWAQGAATTSTVVASADAYVDASVPSGSYGTLTRLRVDTTPEVRSFLRFDLSGLQGSVTRAVLDLTPASSLATGFDVRSTDMSVEWSEGTLTAATAPTVGAVVATSGAVTSGTVVSLDVTGLVQGSVVQVALTARSSTALALASRETSTPPLLRVDTVADPSPVNTALPSVTGTATAGKTLVADPGAWEGALPLAYAYQWRRCDQDAVACADQPGATGASYRLTSADVGSVLIVVVTVSNASGSASAASMPSAVVAPTPAPAGDRVVLAAGDIACSRTSSGAACVQQSTSDVLVAHAADAVLPLGDVQYECGDLADFQDSYDRSWGRVLGVTRPVPGNHEYTTSTNPLNNCYDRPPGAPGYYGYFGASATPDEVGCGVACKGYYSYDLGDWHLIALNSNCGRGAACASNDPMLLWLRNDLTAHAGQCTLAYYHHPRWTSGQELDNAALAPVVSLLHEAGVDVVLNGHDHDYERFAPMDADGQVDPAGGYRQFVVGTGGRNLSSFAGAKASSEVRDASTFGVLKLVLSTSSYSWQFLPAAGSGTFTDAGSQRCHSAPTLTTPPPAPTGLVGTAVGDRVDLDWSAAPAGVVAHRIYRDGALLTTTGDRSGWVDRTAGAGTRHTWAVSAVDADGNASPLSTPVTVATPDLPAPALHRDGFESSGLSTWTSVNGVVLQQAVVSSGRWAARSTVRATGPSYVFTTSATDQSELWVQERVNVLAHSSALSLVRLRDRSGFTMLTVQVSSTGRLSYVNEVTGAVRTSAVPVSLGEWHTLRVHALAGPSGRVELFLDDVPVLGNDEDLGTTLFARTQLGDTGSTHTGDQVFDDVHVGTTLPQPDPTPTPSPEPTPTPSVTVVQLAPAAGTDTTVRDRSASAAELDAVRAEDGIAYTTEGTWGGTGTGTARALSAVACTDPWTCWAAGQRGTVLSTVDGGRAWTTRPAGTNQDLLGVAFADASRGVVVGKRGSLLRTADGGRTWQARDAGTSDDLLAAVWTGANQVVAVGQGGTVVRSLDGGLTWSARASGTSQDLRAVAAVDATRLVAVGKGGTVTRSEDGGASWTATRPGSGHLDGVAARDGRVVAVGEQGLMMSSLDSGRTWSTRTVGSKELTAVSLTSGGGGWVVGRAGTLLTTRDSGATWAAGVSGTTVDLNGVAATASTRGLAVGGTGTVRTTVDGTAWTVQPPAHLEWSVGTAPAKVSTVRLELAYRALSSPPSGTAARLLASVDGVTWTTVALPAPSTAGSVAQVDLTELVGGSSARLAALRVRLTVGTAVGSALSTAHDLVRFEVTG